MKRARIIRTVLFMAAIYALPFLFLKVTVKLTVPHHTIPLPDPVTQEAAQLQWTRKDSTFTLEDIKMDVVYDSSSLAEQKAFFQRHMRGDAVMIIQANAGFKHILYNLMCSLRRIDPALLKTVVIWAQDVELEKDVREHLRNSLVYSKKNSSVVPLSDFGIYVSASQDTVAAFQPGGTKEYYNMMNRRPEFFAFLMEKLEINFVFVDADVVFFRDPWTWITDRNGLGAEHVDLNLNARSKQNIKQIREAQWPSRPNINVDRAFQLRVEHEQMYDNPPDFMENDPFLGMEPDIVYSVDPRKHPVYLSDSWEGMPRVPKICGGLFYAKATTRTIDFFKRLGNLIVKSKGKENDQTGADLVLNDPKLYPNVAVVGQLPRCLGRVKGHPHLCPEKGFLPKKTLKLDYTKLYEQVKKDDSCLRVRILDYWQFTTGLVVEHHTDAVSWDYQRLASAEHEPPYYQHKSRSVPTKTAVAFHANFWDRDKVLALEEFGMWYLDEHDVCLAA